MSFEERMSQPSYREWVCSNCGEVYDVQTTRQVDECWQCDECLEALHLEEEPYAD